MLHICRFKHALISIVAVCLAASGCDKRPAAPKSTTRPAESAYTAEYVAALAAANTFCQAWKEGRYPEGKSLMTVRLVRQHPEPLIRTALTDSGNPRHAAFQIGRGKRLADGRYAFPVRLFFHYAGEYAERIEAPEPTLLLAVDPLGRWRVDEFPIP